MKKYKLKTARAVALIDIAKYTFSSIEFVSAHTIDTKENRNLNKKLGLKNINYYGKRNQSK